MRQLHNLIINRPSLVRCVLLMLLIFVASCQHSVRSNIASPVVKIALLHLQLDYANPKYNMQLVEQGIAQAALHGADWVLTPELALTGYRFDMAMGTSWLPLGPDRYVQHIQALAAKHRITVFFSHIERVAHTVSLSESSNLYNTLFVIDRYGDIIAKHRKINTIKIAEDWSSPGTTVTIANVDGYKVGLLICADAWPAQHAMTLKQQGATIILSSANWAPGLYGPSTTWEDRSGETQLPLFVNNRTGIERQLDFSNAQSVVSYAGQRIFSHSSADSTLLMLEWNTLSKTLGSNTSVRLIDKLPD